MNLWNNATNVRINEPYIIFGLTNLQVNNIFVFFIEKLTFGITSHTHEYNWQPERQWRSAHPASRNINKFHVVQFSTGQKIKIWCPGRDIKKKKN